MEKSGTGDVNMPRSGTTQPRTTTSPESATKRDLKWDMPPFGKILLTENQQKVIKDKYLKDAPSVEHWLWGVARNIALSELFFVPEFRDAILEDVKHQSSSYETPAGKSELLLFHAHTTEHNEMDRNLKKVIANMVKLVQENPKAKETVLPVAEKFYDLLANFDFLPNSPTLMNAGRDLQQLSACYVLPIGDSIEAWGDVVKHTMLIHKSGGGTGFSGCRVRPRGDQVKTTKGIASGALSPFLMINHCTQEVKQGGTRRGANMGILPYWHPDIIDFVDMKLEEGRLDNFNISVAVDNDFFNAVAENRDIEIRNPRGKEAVRRINAKELFDRMCKNAWQTGDPGIIVIDRINNSLSNPTPHIGQVEATNPCGEQPLLPYEPCNLGSINLAKFVVMGQIDWDRLGETAKLCTRFLDNVIDVNNYPLPQIEHIAKGNRRIGLGVMGWAEMLALLGIPYDSDEAIATAGKLMEFINTKSREASIELAEERGAFPFIKDSVYDKTGPNKQPYGIGMPRNCARTTIAPTGTIAIGAGLQGGGIEPFFAIVYTRYNAKALDALKKGETPDEGDVFHEINPIFKKVAETNNHFGLKPEELWEKIEKNHNSVRGIPEIPMDVQKAFANAHDTAVEWHVKHQCMFQQHVDNGVSKTINLSNSATVEDIQKTYLLAYELGCKGITVYRDGCKSQQVLNVNAVDKAKEKKKTDLSAGLSSMYFKLDTGYGPLHIHIDHDEDGQVVRVFTNTTPIGTEVAGLTSVLGILLSKYLELGGDVNDVRKHLNSIKSDRPFGFGPGRVESIPHAVSVALSRFLQKTAKKTTAEDEKTAQTTLPPNTGETRHCPKCYSPNIAFLSGCSGPTCFECGHSECS